MLIISNRITTSVRSRLLAAVSAACSSRARAYHGDPHLSTHRPISTTQPSIAIAAHCFPLRRLGLSAAPAKLLLFPARRGIRFVHQPRAPASIARLLAGRIPSLPNRAYHHSHRFPPDKGTGALCMKTSSGAIPSRQTQSVFLPRPLRFKSAANSRSVSGGGGVGGGSNTVPTPSPSGPAPTASTSEFPGNTQSLNQDRAQPGPAHRQQMLESEETALQAPEKLSQGTTGMVEPTIAASPEQPRAALAGHATEADTGSYQPQDGGFGGSTPVGPVTLGQQAPLPLPAPGEGEGEGDDATKTTTVEVNGKAVILDSLGPMVVGRDGTLARIANWGEMSEIERQNTLRILGKRNQLRLSALRAAAAADALKES